MKKTLSLLLLLSAAVAQGAEDNGNIQNDFVNETDYDVTLNIEYDGCSPHSTNLVAGSTYRKYDTCTVKKVSAIVQKAEGYGSGSGEVTYNDVQAREYERYPGEVSKSKKGTWQVVPNRRNPGTFDVEKIQ